MTISKFVPLLGTDRALKNTMFLVPGTDRALENTMSPVPGTDLGKHDVGSFLGQVSWAHFLIILVGCALWGRFLNFPSCDFWGRFFCINVFLINALGVLQG